MKRLAMALGLIVLLLISSHVLSVENNDNYFKPTLTINEDPICEDLLADIQQKFLTEIDFKSLFYFSPYPKIDVADLIPLPRSWYDDPDVLLEELPRSTNNKKKTFLVPTAVIYVNEEKLYLHLRTNPGCGGACESYSVLPSANPAFNQMVDSSALSPATGGYKIYKSPTKQFRLLQVNASNELQVLEIVGDKKWKMSCSIQLRPTDFSGFKSKGYLAARQSVETLKPTVRKLMRGSGNCGSMRTHTRWSREFPKTLETIWYRPWALGGLRFNDAYGTYQKDLEGLSDWSMLGELEHEALKNYLSQLELSIKALAAFYQNHFNWAPDHAQSVAKTALTEAVSSTIRFYSFDPFDEAERKLRRAILEKQPMDQIRMLAQGYQEGKTYRNESLLNVATKYPQAMAYLLKQGLNPNKQNDFGKTPLMYAAQYNQLQAAKLLLDKGADPNLVTRRPMDNCFYTLRTLNTSALHYAARYASPELIKLLIDNGAVTYIEATYSYRNSIDGGKPKDWLEHYARGNSVGTNPNIPVSKLSEVQTWLATNTNPIAHLDNLILEAERFYQEKNLGEAYKNISLALQIDPGNERALSDMSIIGLRYGKLGESVDASTRLMRSNAHDKLKANAYFNYGLACLENPRITHDGTYHCRFNKVYPFFKAYSLYGTETRKERLLAAIKTLNTTPYCEITEPKIKISFSHGVPPEKKEHGNFQYFFILHENAQAIKGNDLAWTDSKYGAKIVPELVDKVVFGKLVFSVFKAPRGVYLSFPYQLFGHQCNWHEKRAVKLQ